MLQLQDLHVRYGGIQALRGISLGVREHQIVTLLGANGAGKSTSVRAVSGMVPIASGTVLFGGRNIRGLPPHEIQKLGLVHVPEGRRIFANLTVRENLLMGAYNNHDKEDVARTTKMVFSTFPIIASRLDQLGGTLSGGEQQMLAMARAVMLNPEVVLLDEPSMGLAPIIVQEVFNTIRRLKETGITLLLVEQFAKSALEVADYAYVMDRGRIAIEGTPAHLREDERVLAAYLG